MRTFVSVSEVKEKVMKGGGERKKEAGRESGRARTSMTIVGAGICTQGTIRKSSFALRHFSDCK